MKKYSLIYLILAVAQIACGFFGSCFLLIASGALMLLRAAQIYTTNAKKGAKLSVSVFFALLSVYLAYYSVFILIRQLDYADLRPDFWLFIPIGLTLATLISVFASARDAKKEDDLAESDTLISYVTEDLTAFALLFIGWFGTFIFEFYFEYAASFCVAVCILKNTYEFIFPPKKAETVINTQEPETQP